MQMKRRMNISLEGLNFQGQTRIMQEGSDPATQTPSPSNFSAGSTGSVPWHFPSPDPTARAALGDSPSQLLVPSRSKAGARASPDPLFTLGLLPSCSRRSFPVLLPGRRWMGCSTPGSAQSPAVPSPRSMEDNSSILGCFLIVSATLPCCSC